MGKAELNVAKRSQMKTLIENLIGKGWTRASIADLMDVTSSCVSSWANGKSMGTNAQRDMLAALPAFSKERLVTHLTAKVAECQKWFDKATNQFAAYRAKVKAGAVDGIYTTTSSYDYGWVKGTVVNKINAATGMAAQIVDETFPDRPARHEETHHDEFASYRQDVEQQEKVLKAAQKRLAFYKK